MREYDRTWAWGSVTVDIKRSGALDQEDEGVGGKSVETYGNKKHYIVVNL